MPQGSRAYAGWHAAGVIFGVLLLVVGGYYLLAAAREIRPTCHDHVR